MKYVKWQIDLGIVFRCVKTSQMIETLSIRTLNIVNLQEVKRYDVQLLLIANLGNRNVER